MNRHLASVVVLGGVMRTRRTIVLVESEMPREVGSFEEGVAWVADCLDDHAPGRRFTPAAPARWLDVGRRHLLPWRRRLAEYESRPQCWVQGDWARLALRSLNAHVPAADAGVQVAFAFDGEVLTIRCGGRGLEVWSE